MFRRLNSAVWVLTITITILTMVSPFQKVFASSSSSSSSLAARRNYVAAFSAFGYRTRIGVPSASSDVSWSEQQQQQRRRRPHSVAFLSTHHQYDQNQRSHRIMPADIFQTTTPMTATPNRRTISLPFHSSTALSISLSSSASYSSSSSSFSSSSSSDNYDNNNINNNEDGDTIFALSSGFTGAQPTAVAVVRISGSKAHSVLQQLSSPTLKLPPPRKAVLRKLYYSPNHNSNNNNNNLDSDDDDSSSNNSSSSNNKRRMIDHALVLLFQQPNSFTGEDLVELQCHGSRAVVAQLLEVLPTLGCRLAEPGEFTQRAFGRGKLDLVQVEALADLLGADTSSQLQQALSQLDGTLSALYDRWRSQLISGLAHAEAVIDFGDDERLGNDEEEGEHPDDVYAAQWNVWGTVQGRMNELRSSMVHHLQDARRGELVRQGVSIAIVGPPNAGKSSLFNLLARRDAAIVSPIAGTTRDVLEVSLDLGGIKCVLSDTAGVRSETMADSLELEGMKRTRIAAGKADLVVAMVDATDIDLGLEIVKNVLQEQRQEQQNEDTSQPQASSSLSSLSSDHVLLVLNKLDLINGTIQYPHNYQEKSTSTTNQEPALSFGGTYEISCATQTGIDAFLDGLTKMVQARIQQQGPSSSRTGTTSTTNTTTTGPEEGALITRARHRQHVQAASEALERFDTLSRQGSMAVDMAAEELRLAASELGRITGAVDVEDVLDVLFTDFCIGK